MIRVSVEIRSGVARFQRTVWAESIERAVRLTAMRYPGSDARVRFPIEPEGFFAEGQIAETVQPEAPAMTDEPGAGNHAPAVDRQLSMKYA